MDFEISGISAAPWVPLAWGFLVGLVFSVVGAAGGILASVGLISVLGVSNVNLVKPMAQMLTLISPLIAVPSYFKQHRLVPGLALLLGAGGIAGALIGSTLSLNYLDDLHVFKPVFGVFILLIALQVAWQLLRPKPSGSTRAGRAASAFEHVVTKGEPAHTLGVKQLGFSVMRCEFTFGNERFDYNPWVPVLVGVGIAVISSALGVGGGFLLVPFMSIVLGLPMTIVAGTAALAIFISSVTSIGNYVRLGVELDLPLLALMLIGTVAGSVLGPILSKYLREAWFKALLMTILAMIGLRYLSAW
ncbi:MAG: TSUP family transporter [Gammaproteobacteria bacterium]|nr:TSUP family transporter [Gammaproteobacteria bacterium]